MVPPFWEFFEKLIGYPPKRKGSPFSTIRKIFGGFFCLKGEEKRIGAFWGWKPSTLNWFFLNGPPPIGGKGPPWGAKKLGQI